LGCSALRSSSSIGRFNFKLIHYLVSQNVDRRGFFADPLQSKSLSSP
jgi:hypothetical protein